MSYGLSIFNVENDFTEISKIEPGPCKKIKILYFYSKNLEIRNFPK